MDSVTMHAFACEVLHPRWLGYEQDVANRVGDDTVDLLRHVRVPRAQASFELTSPTTKTPCGCCAVKTGSNLAMISPVCCAWLPDPTASSTSGLGIARSSKNTFDSFSS